MRFNYNLRIAALLPLVLITLLGCFSSCATRKGNSKIAALKNDYCAPAIKYQQDDSLSLEDGRLADPSIRAKLNMHDLKMASHLGLNKILVSYLNSSSSVDRLAAKQQLIEKILLFNTQIEAIVAELDCNGERYEQLARYLDGKNGHTTSRLTVASIITAAAVSVSTALIKNDNVNKGINIGGGLAGAGLGFMLLNPKGKKIKLQSGKGLLTNVWNENNTDTSFPPALWRIMMDKTFSNSGESSLLQTLKRRWVLFVFNGKVDSTDEVRFFNSGGYFSEQDVQHLADMHNQLQASVRSVQQDTRGLIEAINRL
ncbi:hypothetical protein LT679_10225 [Mucilaginibacter roseus]|uniref:Lipoprotein n=1 Tax=Mucilaginibacter roseus TaxID=1528868 RepID=A0ABS8U2V9_9SPHI|nr:hypothetical protein [Mucilaginibacter roseus]MCD8740977.1 hypothetical protein [Mucilaginibacter roseus]